MLIACIKNCAKVKTKRSNYVFLHLSQYGNILLVFKFFKKLIANQANENAAYSIYRVSTPIIKQLIRMTVG